MSTEDGIIYMISRSLKIFFSPDLICFLHASNRLRIHGFIPYSSDEAINMLQHTLKPGLTLSIAYGCMRGLKKRSLKFGVVLNCQRSF